MKRMLLVFLSIFLLFLVGCQDTADENRWEGIEFESTDSERMEESESQTEDYQPEAEYAYRVDAAGGIYISAKYDSDKDIQYYLCRHSINQLFDFQQVWIVDSLNSNARIHFAEAKDRVVWGNGDWHAPIQIDAIHNGDGDVEEGVFFTGGMHGYKNAAVDTTPTARCVSLRFLADGMELSKGTEGYADEITMCWENLVQASNTMKEDGRGREVLRERHTLIFRDGTFFTVTELVPLEDLTCYLWYGFQMIYQSGNQKTLIYGTGDEARSYPASEDSKSGNSSCEQIRLINDRTGLVQELFVNTSVGLGDRGFCSSDLSQAMFGKSYGKAYGTIVNRASTLYCGEIYRLEGYYKMYQQELDS